MGKLHVRLLSSGRESGRNLWVTSGVPQDPRTQHLGWFIDKVFRFFKQGKSGFFYTDDELVHRTVCFGSAGRRTFLKKVAEFLLSGRG